MRIPESSSSIWRPEQRDAINVTSQFVPPSTQTSFHDPFKRSVANGLCLLTGPSKRAWRALFGGCHQIDAASLVDGPDGAGAWPVGGRPLQRGKPWSRRRNRRWQTRTFASEDRPSMRAANFTERQRAQFRPGQRSGANAPVSLAGSAGAGEIEGRRGLKIGREIGAELIEVATSYEVATS